MLANYLKSPEYTTSSAARSGGAYLSSYQARQEWVGWEKRRKFCVYIIYLCVG